MSAALLSFLVGLLAIANPVGAIPVYLSLCSGRDEKTCRRVPRVTALVFLLVLCPPYHTSRYNSAKGISSIHSRSPQTQQKMKMKINTFIILTLMSLSPQAKDLSSKSEPTKNNHLAKQQKNLALNTGNKGFEEENLPPPLLLEKVITVVINIPGR